MDNKSAVSALQEFCAKSKNIPPTYDFIDGEDGGYVCKVVLMEIEAYGNGNFTRYPGTITNKCLSNYRSLQAGCQAPGCCQHSAKDPEASRRESESFLSLISAHETEIFGVFSPCCQAHFFRSHCASLPLPTPLSGIFSV